MLDKFEINLVLVWFLLSFPARDDDCTLSVSKDIQGFTEVAFPMLKDYPEAERKQLIFDTLWKMREDGTIARILKRYGYHSTHNFGVALYL